MGGESEGGECGRGGTGGSGWTPSSGTRSSMASMSGNVTRRLSCTPQRRRATQQERNKELNEQGYPASKRKQDRKRTPETKKKDT